jgi:ribosome-associated protein
MPTETHTRQQEKQALEFAIESARLAAHTRCHDVSVLDVRGISPVTDYLVIGTGTSPRQMRTVCDDLAEMAEQRGQHPIGLNGLEGDAWMLIDFVDVVIHIFSPQARAFYDLDNLWGDARKVEWAEGSNKNVEEAAKEGIENRE